MIWYGLVWVCMIWYGFIWLHKAGYFAMHCSTPVLPLPTLAHDFGTGLPLGANALNAPHCTTIMVAFLQHGLAKCHVGCRRAHLWLLWALKATYGKTEKNACGQCLCGHGVKVSMRLENALVSGARGAQALLWWCFAWAVRGCFCHLQQQASIVSSAMHSASAACFGMAILCFALALQVFVPPPT